MTISHPRFWKLLIAIITIILVDQLSKGAVQDNMHIGESFTVIDGLFNITYVKNPGAAFGFGREYSNLFRIIFFLVVPVIACFWLFTLLLKSLKGPAILSTAYALILAGAIGNLIDRFMLRYVVDMFDFYWGDAHFATFNVADSSISVAAGLLIIDFLMQLKKKKPEENLESATKE